MKRTITDVRVEGMKPGSKALLVVDYCGGVVNPFKGAVNPFTVWWDGKKWWWRHRDKVYGCPDLGQEFLDEAMKFIGI